MPIPWIIAIIAGFTSAWQTRDCAEGDEACEARNERLEERRLELAEIIQESSERESHDPVLVLSIIANESSFRADPCMQTVSTERILSREVVDEEQGKEEVAWVCGSTTCRRTVWRIDEQEDRLTFSTCSAGEAGYMQVLPYSQWARGGTEIPGTDIVLSNSYRERETQLIDARINIAIGCRELADHREHNEGTAEEWWEWVGAYNAGTVRCNAARRYSRNILRRYIEFCSYEVEDEDGTYVPLSEVWEGCAAAQEAYGSD